LNEVYCPEVRQAVDTPPIAVQKSEKGNEGSPPTKNFTIKKGAKPDVSGKEVSNGIPAPPNASTNALLPPGGTAAPTPAAASPSQPTQAAPPVTQAAGPVEQPPAQALPPPNQAAPPVPSAAPAPTVTPTLPLATGSAPYLLNHLLAKKGLAGDIRKILERGVLRVGMCSIDQPPFHVKKDGQFKGFDIDLAQKLSEVLGVKMQIVEGADWDSVIDMMIDDCADVIISNLSLTPERAARILCSKPYAKIRQCLLLNRVLLARAGSDGLVTLRQIFDRYSNNTLLIQEGTACIDWATSLFPKAKISTTGSWEEILYRTQNKEVMGTISDELEIKKRMKGGRSVEFMPVVIKGMFDFMVIGMPLSAISLLEVVNAFIDCNNIQCEAEEKHEQT
jgi:ABC-type amino acid transport substrate-binding protein